MKATQPPICAYANFLGAIFATPPKVILTKWGIALPVSRPCQSCGEPITHRKARYCEKCRIISVECPSCATLFLVRRAEMLRQFGRRFCSHQCFGKLLGKTFGSMPRKKKYDYDLVWTKHLETGFGRRRLSRLLNIPEGAISMILRVKRLKEAPLLSFITHST